MYKKGIDEVELQNSANSVRSTQSQTEFDQPLPQILNKKVSLKTQKHARFAFTIMFTLLVLGKSLYWFMNPNRIVLGPEECIRD